MKNNGSVNNYDAFLGSGIYSIGGPTPTLTSLTSNLSSPQLPGTTITWSAAAAGGTPPLQYAFYLYSSTTGSWTLARPYSTSNAWAWTPSVAGSYSVAVWVRSTGSTAAYDAWMGSNFYSISGGPVPTVTSLTSNLPSPRKVGTTITWSATASGGTGPLQYAFYLYSPVANSWVLAQSYSTTRIWAWTPTVPGTYAVAVWVRNNGSSTPYDAWLGPSYFTVTP